MEGVDDNWTIVQGGQNIKYSNLKPGTYDLKVEASTINGLWRNDDGKFSTLQVKIYNVGEKLPVVIKVNDNNEEINRLIGEKTYEEIIDFIKD